jgi:hypothetical protein
MCFWPDKAECGGVHIFFKLCQIMGPAVHLRLSFNQNTINQLFANLFRLYSTFRNSWAASMMPRMWLIGWSMPPMMCPPGSHCMENEVDRPASRFITSTCTCTCGFRRIKLSCFMEYILMTAGRALDGRVWAHVEFTACSVVPLPLFAECSIKASTTADN